MLGSSRLLGVRHLATKASKGAGVTSKVCAILGSQWGDEGKGKLADVLAKGCVSTLCGSF